MRRGAFIGPMQAGGPIAKRTRSIQSFAVNPRPVLAARTDRPAGAEPERRQHRGEGSAVALEDQAGANARPPSPARGLHRLGFPFHADAGEEVVSGRGVFGGDAIVQWTVVAHGRSADQHRGVVRRAGSLRSALRHQDPTLEDSILVRGRPASTGNGFASKVDHGAGAVDFRCPGSDGAVGLPGDAPSLDLVMMLAASAPRPGGRRGPAPSASGRPRNPVPPEMTIFMALA